MSAIGSVIVAVCVAFVISLLGTPLAIGALRRLKAGQPIRDINPSGHAVKRGTPTMGGLVFIGGTLVAYVAGHLMLKTLSHDYIVPPGPDHHRPGAARPVRLLRRDRILGRLRQGPQEKQCRVAGPVQAGVADAGRRCLRHRRSLLREPRQTGLRVHHRRQHHDLVRPGHQLAGRRPRRRGDLLHPSADGHHQRSEPDRRPGRPGHRRVHHGDGRLHVDRVLAVPALVR